MCYKQKWDEIGFGIRNHAEIKFRLYDKHVSYIAGDILLAQGSYMGSMGTSKGGVIAGAALFTCGESWYTTLRRMMYVNKFAKFWLDLEPSTRLK